MKDSLVKFWERVQVAPTGCWLWQGCISDTGYGRLYSVGNRQLAAHRVAWEMLRGDIPKGLTLDHLCRVRACVNPAHLEPVTMRENILRGEGMGAKNAKKETCPRGHPLSGENVWVGKRGWRLCKICDRAKSKRRKLRLKALAP